MALERLFAHFKNSDAPSTAFYDPLDPRSYDAYLKSMMEDCKDYEDSILAGDRSEAQLLYYGYSPSLDYTDAMGPYRGEDPTQTFGELLDKYDKDAPNRSTFVSTDVRDAIMLMLPGLVRLFGASESPVFLVPRNEAESDMAEQGTDYVNYTFWNDNPGFLILYGAFKDALTVKTGFVKWWSDDRREKQRKKFVNVTAEQLQLIISENPSARIFEIGRPIPNQTPSSSMAAPPPPAIQPGGGQPSPGPQNAANPLSGPPPGPMAGASFPSQLTAPPPPLYDYAIIEFEVSKPVIHVAGVPPEEMRLDRYARTFKDSRIIGHERIVPVDQLVAMGYDRELCLEHIQSSESTFTVEPQLRNPGRFMGTRMGDGVKFAEWYIKIDKDGDGFPELRRIVTMGENYEIVEDEEANRVKFALFSCDPISHTIVGDSMADYTSDIQRIKTNLMRSTLDSAAESLNPKTVVNELMVTIDDAMNDDLGAVIRTRGDPNASVMFTNTPFLGQQMMPVIQVLNDVLSRRTGLTDAAKGLDPKALQSSTMIGVEAVINGAQERIELVARVLCETGFKDLFSGLYNEICENPNQSRTLKLRGKFVPYDTSTFDASLSVEVNANLGKGSDMVRMLALNQIKQDQQLIVTTYGLNNPVCGIPEMLNTITDMMSLANIKNVGRYFKTPTPQAMQAIMAQPKTPDPQAVLAQAQLEKARTDAAKAAAQQSLDRDKLQKDLDFKYRQLHAKSAYEGQKLQVDARKAGVDSDQLEREMQMDSAQAEHEMNLKAQQSQSDIALDQQKAASDMAQAHAKNQNDMAVAHMKANSAHQLGQQKIVSQHVLGALAAQNQPDEGEP